MGIIAEIWAAAWSGGKEKVYYQRGKAGEKMSMLTQPQLIVVMIFSMLFGSVLGPRASTALSAFLAFGAWALAKENQKGKEKK
jgi:hypothetical protein